MRNAILLSSFAALAVAGCDEPAAEPVVQQELGDYNAIGTEPGWNIEIKGENIAFTTQNGNGFTLPVYRMDKTASGWEVKGFSDAHNINIYITSDEACSDGMSDRSYADTVKIEASGNGVLSGCGGTITEGPDGPP
jgi:uncharacterized membrane protein